MLTPTVRKTWAPVGCTPLVRHHFVNERISMISGISVSPTRRRLGLFGIFFWDNIGQDEVVVFLRQVLRHIHGHLIALLDNSNTHQGGPLRDLCRRVPRLHLEYFPSYAPDLNPDEAVWALLKGKLANGRPDDLRELEEHLEIEFRQLAESQPKLRGCIRQSELSISLA